MLNPRVKMVLALIIAVAGLAAIACSSGDDTESEPNDSSATTTESQSESTDSPAETESESTPASDPTAIPVSASGLSDDPDLGIHMRSSDNLDAAPDPVEAARRADLIVIATVDEPGEPFWTTVSGNRPGATVEGRMPQVPLDQLRWGSSPQIFTPWTMSIVQSLKGELPDSESILVNWWGGDISPDKFELVGEMAFISGEELVLYLKDCGPDHLDKYGSPYRFIKRLVLTPEGFAYLKYEGEETPLRDVQIVIDKETGPPITETFCG